MKKNHKHRNSFILISTYLCAKFSQDTLQESATVPIMSHTKNVVHKNELKIMNKLKKR